MIRANVSQDELLKRLEGIPNLEALSITPVSDVERRMLDAIEAAAEEGDGPTLDDERIEQITTRVLSRIRRRQSEEKLLSDLHRIAPLNVLESRPVATTAAGRRMLDAIEAAAATADDRESSDPERDATIAARSADRYLRARVLDPTMVMHEGICLLDRFNATQSQFELTGPTYAQLAHEVALVAAGLSQLWRCRAAAALMSTGTPAPEVEERSLAESTS